MASLNKVLLIGNLTRDPELRYTASGTAVSDLGLAVNNRVKREGQWTDEVCFIDITVWGATAENCGKYLSKGRPVFIEGRLQLDTWEDKEGKKRSKMRVTAERVQFLGGGDARSNNASAPNNANSRASFASNSDAAGEDIPF